MEFGIDSDGKTERRLINDLTQPGKPPIRVHCFARLPPFLSFLLPCSTRTFPCPSPSISLNHDLNRQVNNLNHRITNGAQSRHSKTPPFNGPRKYGYRIYLLCRSLSVVTTCWSVRRWLVTGGTFSYQPARKGLSLPPNHARPIFPFLHRRCKAVEPCAG